MNGFWKEYKMKILRKIKYILKRPITLQIPKYPQSIILEPTNACNLKCRMCPIYGEGVNRKRDIGFIKKESWAKITDEIGSWPSPVNLDIHGAGEPLLHPDFFDMVSHAKNFNNISVGFLSNATLLDKEKAKAIIDLRVDWVCFSLDGAEKEIFEYYRKGAVLDYVEENIKYLLSLKKNEKPNIFLNMVKHEKADLEKFINKWAGLVDSITISLKRPTMREKNKRLKLMKPCSLLYQQLVIGWPGKTGLCCEDLWGDYITGDTSEETLLDIWQGKALTRARRLHERGEQEKLSLCTNCDTTIFHQYTETILMKKGRTTIVREELPKFNHELAVPYNDELKSCPNAKYTTI